MSVSLKLVYFLNKVNITFCVSVRACFKPLDSISYVITINFINLFSPSLILLVYPLSHCSSSRVLVWVFYVNLKIPKLHKALSIHQKICNSCTWKRRISSPIPLYLHPLSIFFNFLRKLIVTCWRNWKDWNLYSIQL